ncbi:hypothetical protein GPB2148_3146 [marine gamma proteobacterium HTCC2148]|jgi:hypothetical protein|uniref:hypothetical protein n=1 Tax=Candidatus Seongchinamella marina TaxID=2518990 RepID=UPI00018717F7|nr:hypothetical protein [Candidatus Seongchinamella marina]EEB80330.1 hypothetical protein GPB2148_3146 [marine gamma proteobacterium HTCC2148]MDG1389278.1 hypothetical protein [Halioglobus sp.]
MTNVFVIRNQHGHYWAKSKQWVSGGDPKTVLRAKHEDEAINTLFELSTKDIELRGEAVAAELDERGNPVIEPSQIPLPCFEEEPESTEEPLPADANELAHLSPDGVS